MKIGTRYVGPGRPTFIIAEIGSNHAGSLDLALALIDAAAEAGADAAKFQYFRVDRFLVPRPDPEALRKYELPDAWLPQLKARCTERGIEFLCTAFDLQSLDVVDPFVNAHKIGSYELTAEYVRTVTAKGKPIIASLGRHFWPLETRVDDLALLICRSEYPAKIDGYFDHGGWPPLGALYWGVSDHTLDPFTVPCVTVVRGGHIVEKHMRHQTALVETPDSCVSVGHITFASMVEAIRKTERAVR